MSETRKVEVTALGITVAGEDKEPGDIIEVPKRSATDLINAEKAKAVIIEDPKEDNEQQEDKEGSLKDDQEVQEYQKLYNALDKFNRDDIYKVAKEIIEIPYDINKDPLLETIIEADKTKAVLNQLAE